MNRHASGVPLLSDHILGSLAAASAAAAAAVLDDAEKIVVQMLAVAVARYWEAPS